jgi:DNA replication protein DnaC
MDLSNYPTLEQLKASEKAFKKRHHIHDDDEIRPVQSLTPERKAELDAIKAAAPKPVEKNLTDVIKELKEKTIRYTVQVVPFQRGSWQDCLDMMDLCVRSIALKEGKKVIIDDEEARIYRLLTAYFSQNAEQCKNYGIDPRKGIWLVGRPGVGKSFAMRVAEEFCKQLAKLDYDRTCFRRYSAKAVYDEVADAKRANPALDKFKKMPTALFDDLGEEPLIVKDYGNDIEVFGSILSERTNRYIEQGIITHITSNYFFSKESDNKILKLYGPRIHSRCFQLFNEVFYNGSEKGDKRKIQQ